MFNRMTLMDGDIPRKIPYQVQEFLALGATRQIAAVYLGPYC